MTLFTILCVILISVVSEFQIYNNGDTIQVILLQDGTPAQLSGYNLDNVYTFAQMHLHWNRNDSAGSEHAMDSHHYPIEAHLVHFNQKYPNFSVAAQSDDPKALVVLGIFLSTALGTDDFDVIAAHIPKDLDATFNVKEKLDLSVLLPQFGDPFYRYSGSLTTPPCTQSVEWMVLKRPLSVGSKLIEQLRATSIKMNVRPLQGENDRKIEYLVRGSGNNLRNNFELNFIWFTFIIVFSYS